MGARLYDPTLGRFLQGDRIAGGPANTYDYANQDPVNGFDLGGTRSFYCSDDFCGAAQARIQGGNLEAPLEISSTYNYDNQDIWETAKIDAMPLPKTRSSWRDAIHAAAETVGLAATGVGVVFLGAATGAEDVTTIGAISTTVSLVGAGTNCADKGLTSESCAGGVAAAGVSLGTGGLAANTTSHAGRVALAGANVIWNYLTQRAGY